MKKIGKRAERFLRTEFTGDGIYYRSRGGRNLYANTFFQTFNSNNPKMVKVISKGNNAPRGGKVGDYFEVEFTNLFNKTYADWIIYNIL